MDNSTQSEDTERLLENLALRVARNRTNVAKWDLNILMVLFSVLMGVIIMVSLNVDTMIVAGVSIAGLLIVWIVGWRRGKKLYDTFYQEEITGLKQDGKPEPPPEIEQLSTREREILSLAARGYSNKIIANELGISINTVKVYFSRILSKFEAKDRTEAVVMAIKNKMITLE